MALLSFAAGPLLPERLRRFSDVRYALVQPAVCLLVPLVTAGMMGADQVARERASGLWDQLRMTRLAASQIVMAHLVYPLAVASLAAAATLAFCRALGGLRAALDLLGLCCRPQITALLVPVAVTVVCATLVSALVGVACGSRPRRTWHAIAATILWGVLLQGVAAAVSLSIPAALGHHMAPAEKVMEIECGRDFRAPWWLGLTLRVTLATWYTCWLTAAAMNVLAAVLVWRSCVRAITTSGD